MKKMPSHGCELPNLKALIVDDDPAVRHLIERQLYQLGVNVVRTAADGAEAMQVIEGSRTRFDVVLCDLRMPNEDGVVLLRRLAALDVPPRVILASGEDPLVLEAARRLGFSHRLTVLGVISKPHTIGDLAAVLAGLTAPATRSHEHRPSAPLLDRGEIQRALKENRVETWFQPQIDLVTGRVVGAEALVRLRHPLHGLLLPGSFLAAAEEHDLLAALTEFVLREAVAWCHVWQDRGRTLSVSVNVSAATMHDLSYPDCAAALCVKYGVNPTNVVFELTESSVARNASALLDILTRLRLKGFRVSIDDFGTGHSSLEQVRILPFNELKLDHTLVRDATCNPRSRLILKNSVTMASQLGMSTVAEGVESTAALDLVSDLGCDLAQGFLISKPMPADAVMGWLATHESIPTAWSAPARGAVTKPQIVRRSTTGTRRTESQERRHHAGSRTALGG
ncbi:MAG: EAL domain-containing response regulator [Acidobacteria bacterium]|nr:EAL domain-containing response regulator [Acidobacteriota bacterium]